MKTRRASRVPRAVFALLAAGLLAQLALRGPSGAPEARAPAPPHPPARPLLRVAALGEPRLLSRLLMLWLLTFERHAGAGVPLASLDYDALRAWLARILELDPGYAAPLRAAVRVYAAVPSPEKQRVMLDFVHERFREDPGRRWPWLLFAAVEARHRMGDLPLALRYARSLGEHAAGAGMPAGARNPGAGILRGLAGQAAAARKARTPERGRAGPRRGAAASPRGPAPGPRRPRAGGWSGGSGRACGRRLVPKVGRGRGAARPRARPAPGTRKRPQGFRKGRIEA